MMGSSNKLHSLEILRAIAAVAVVLFHTSRHYSIKGATFLGGWFDAGFFGVDIFFVLSGFVIYYTSYSKIGASAAAFPFFVKRLLRIYPAYWLLLFAPMGVLFLMAPQFLPYAQPFTDGSWVRSFFLLFGHPELTQISWTLSFEMYLYTLFALVIWKPQLKWLGFGIAFLSLLQLGFNVFADFPYLKRFYFSTLNVEFLLGVVAAYMVAHHKEVISRNWTWFFLLFGIAGILYSASIPVSVPYLNGYRVLFFGLPAALLIWSLVQLEVTGALKLQWPIWILVGNASYALYLIHSPLVSAGVQVQKHFPFLSSQVFSVLVCLLIIVVAVFLHKKVEWSFYKYLNQKFIDVK